MIESVDGLLKQYEGGLLSRRELLAAIAVLIAPKTAAAQKSVLQARTINHLNIRVNDVARSEAFYRNVLGLPAVRPVVGAAFALDFPGGGFLSLCPLSVASCGVKAGSRQGDIDHFGIGIDNFNAARVESALKAAGFSGVRNATTSVFVTDPDGVTLQLSAADQSYRA
jgi:catechol 2,3-dioxygenase-like lactoylglutathione lyase family enzyme